MNHNTVQDLPPAIDDLIERWDNQSLPPVNQWHPRNARDIDIQIKKNGEWLYQGSPIRRPRLVQLFASVLRIDEDGSTWLVTPGEKLRIEVEDAHFQAILVDVEHKNQQPVLIFTTNVGERVVADENHLIDVKYPFDDGTPVPYIHVRDGLTARLSRSVFLEVATRAEVRDNVAGVASAGLFMPLGPAQ